MALRVETIDGFPAEGVDVSLVQLDSPDPLDHIQPERERDMRAPFGVVDEVRCDSGGIAIFTGLSPGRYRIEVSSFGDRIHVKEIEVYEVPTMDVRLDLPADVPATRGIALANDGAPFTDLLHFVRGEVGSTISPRAGGQFVVVGIPPPELAAVQIFASARGTQTSTVAGGELVLESGERVSFGTTTSSRGK